MRVAVPSLPPGGLQARSDSRFEFTECFTLVDLEEGLPVRTHVVPNPPFEEGVSLAAVNLLLRSRARVVIVGEIGRLPLAALRMGGVDVFEGLGGDVAALVKDLAHGLLPPYGRGLQEGPGLF